MPEVTGYEVAKLYRVGHIGEWRLPIVALTADATSETERLCREAGMDAVLTKPVEAAQLLGALDEIHARLLRPERTPSARRRCDADLRASALHPGFRREVEN